MSEPNSELSIAYVYGGLYNPDSGVSNYVETVGNYFTQEGHNTNFLVARSDVEGDPRVRGLGRVVMMPLNASKTGFALPISKQTVQKTMEELQPDVLDIQMYTPWFDGRFLDVADAKTAVVGRIHALPASVGIEVASRGLRLAARRRLGRFDYVSSTSLPTQEFALSALGIESSVIPNPIDIEHFACGQRLEKYNDGRINIVFLGRLDKRKGTRYLIDALSTLDEVTRKNLRVLIAGKGSLRQDLQDQVQRYGLEETVEFLGYVEEAAKPDLLASADLAVFPAVAGESFGIVLAEAMAAKAGVVLGGDNPGYHSVLGEMPETLFDPKNIPQFAQTLKLFIHDIEERERLHAQQQEAVKQYDISVVGPQLETAYREALARRAA